MVSVTGNIDYISRMLYPLQEVLDEQKLNLNIFVIHNQFDYITVYFVITFCFNQEADEENIEAIPVGVGVFESLKSSIQVKLVGDWDKSVSFFYSRLMGRSRSRRLKASVTI